MSDNDSETLKNLIALNDSATSPEDIAHITELITEYDRAEKSAVQQQATMERLTQQSAAWLLQVTSRHLRDVNPPRNADRTYNAQELVQWTIERRTEAATGNNLADDSQMQIQYLQERIEKLKHENKLASLRIGEKNQRLVDRAIVEQTLAAQAAVLRTSLEKLERQYGADALDIVLEALDEAATITIPGDIESD